MAFIQISPTIKLYYNHIYDQPLKIAIIRGKTTGLRESACDPNGGVGGVAFYSSTNNTNRSSFYRKREGIEYYIVISFKQLIIDPLVKEKKTENRNL